MSITDSLLPEFDYEVANTRKTLERVPDDKFDWQPHPKSMTFGRLATHIAQLVEWGGITLGTETLDIAPGGVPVTPAPAATTNKQLLEDFDRDAAKTRGALAAATDAQMMHPWSLLMNGQSLFTLPRVAVIRTHVMNHMIHHRAQLTVYLRLNDIPVPALYGPSADEGTM